MITIGSSCGGIGDNLIFTPIFYNIPTTFQMVDHPKCRNVSRLIDDLCKIEFVSNPVGCPENISKTNNIILKKLYGLNLNVSPIPKININKLNIEWAKEFLSQYSNPIVFVADNNGNHDPNDFHAKYRIPVKEILQNIINKLINNGYTILQFGLSNKTTLFENTTQILDIDILDLAACYHVIGKYVGIDTGDYWLMIAVGGKAEVICPNSSPFYSHDEWHLKPEMWEKEDSRIKYINFNLDSIYKEQMIGFI